MRFLVHYPTFVGVLSANRRTLLPLGATGLGRVTANQQSFQRMSSSLSNQPLNQPVLACDNSISRILESILEAMDRN
jgi:hypothetical protein